MIEGEKAIRYGQEVSDLLARESVQVAFAEIEEEIIGKWKSGATVEAREESSADYRAFERLKQKLAAFVDRGVTASSDMQRAERRKSER